MTELFLSGGSVEEHDGLVWATVLPVGTWQLTPGRDGQPQSKPLIVVEGHSAEPEVVGLADLLDAFRDGAVQHVTVPLSHADRVEENTGFVRAMRIEQDDKLGKLALRAGFDFTEPLVKEKVKRGTIAGRSAGILFGYANKETGKRWKSVVGHVALTNKPWIAGMAPFGGGTLLSDDDGSYLLDGMGGMAMMSGDGDTEGEGGAADEGAGDQATPLDTLTDTLDAWSDGALEVVAFDGSSAIVRDEDGDLWGFAVADDGTPASTDEWDLLDPGSSDAAAGHLDTFAAGAAAGADGGMDMQGMSEHTITAPKGGDHMGKYDTLTPAQMLEKLAEQDAKLAESARRDRSVAVEARIVELSETGLSAYPGLLKTARSLMLSDDGEVAVNLSEDNDQRTPLTITEVVERLLAAVPLTGLGLSELASERSAGTRPAADTASEQTAQERADDFRRQLGIQKNLITT